jgi:hypothetical protein
MDEANCAVVLFDPMKWGTQQRFQHFYATTYSFDRNAQYSIRGSANHFYKALLIIKITKEFSPRLSEDLTELEAKGYTNSIRGNELSLLIEMIILEFYSSIDCTRHIVTTIYKKHQGVRESTRKFFQAAFDDKIAETVPSEIRAAFKTAQWYDELRRIRDALTHSDIGSCNLDETSQIISYMHPGLGDDRRAFIIKDILAYLDTLKVNINQFTGKVFNFLNTTLLDNEVREICGIFNGFVYSRYVRPSEAIDFNSGRCNAWFDNSVANCPFADKCDAYNRKIVDHRHVGILMKKL